MFCTISDIQITSHLSVDELHSFNLNFSLNNHIYLTYTGLVNNKNAAGLLDHLLNQDKIEVHNRASGEKLFVGYPIDISFSEENKINYITVRAVSYSFMLDLKGTSMSFQHITDTYSDILDKAYGSSEGSIVIRDCDVIEIKKPIFKYKETDWNFTIRMAARVGTVTYPHHIGASPQIYFGIKKTSNKITNVDKVIKGRFHDKYLYDLHFNKHINSSDYNYIQLESAQNFNIGETTYFMDQPFLISLKEFYCENSCIYCKYELTTIAPYIPVEKYNTNIEGLTLKGTAIATAGELIKIHFDIDETQDVGKAFWFSYKPITGNNMHTMPQIGTTVMSTFCSDTDDSLIATHVIHENNYLSDMSDYNDRFYTTEFKKRLAMLPKSLYFRSDYNHVKLEDNKGMSFWSDSNIQISSLGDISTYSKNETTINTPEHIYMTKTTAKSAIDFAGNEINIKSPDTVISSDPNAKTLAYPNENNDIPTEIGKMLALTVIGATPLKLRKG